MKRNLVASLSLLLTLSAASAFAATDYYEGWDVPGDPAGWGQSTTDSEIFVTAGGGNPGGFLLVYQTGFQFSTIGATTDLPDASGSYASIVEVSFDVQYFPGIVSAAFRVRYHDSTFNGWSYPLPNDFTPGWHHYVIPIDPTLSDADAILAGWVPDGPPGPDMLSFAATMGDVYHPELRFNTAITGTTDGPELSPAGFGIQVGIDNFRLSTCNSPTQILNANFTTDTPGTAPDLTLPGAPAGDYLTIGEASGTVRVQASFGNLLNNPVVMDQVPGIGSMHLLAYQNDTPLCNQVRYSWKGLSASSDNFFMAMVLRDASSLIVASVEYRPNGELTYNSAGVVGPTIPVTYTPNVAQQFEIVVDLVNETTSLFIDGAAVAGFQDVPYAEAGAGDPIRLGFEAGGTDAQTFAFDDITATTCTCVCDPDENPPSLDVVLDRTTLWPPNHKMAQVCVDDFNANDDCDENLTIALVSVTSDEPDNGIGDGDTEGDIEIVPGNPPTCFNLRSERQGGGDGRVYTIVYSATDDGGNTVYDTVTVEVPHDQGGGANSAGGFNAQGTGLVAGATEITLVIPGSLASSAQGIRPETALLGNELGVVAPSRTSYVDANGDKIKDLVLYYDGGLVLGLKQSTDLSNAALYESWTSTGELTKSMVAPEPSTISLRYQIGKQGYLVSDIFGLDRIKLSEPGDGRLPEDGGFSLDPGAGSISFAVTLAQSGSVHVEIFNVLGQKVRTLVDQDMASGSHSITWDGRDDSGQTIASGMYFARIVAPGFTSTKRIAVTR